MNFISLKAQRDVFIASRAERVCECAIKPPRVQQGMLIRGGERYFHLGPCVACAWFECYLSTMHIIKTLAPSMQIAPAMHVWNWIFPSTYLFFNKGLTFVDSLSHSLWVNPLRGLRGPKGAGAWNWVALCRYRPATSKIWRQEIKTAFHSVLLLILLYVEWLCYW